MRFTTFFALAATLGCGAEPSTATAPAQAADVKAAPAAAPAAANGLPAVVATIGGKPVKASELEEAASAQLFQLRMQMHQAYEGALNQLIDTRLKEGAAKKRGISVEALVKAEVDEKLPVVDEAAIEAFFSENKARMGGADLTEVRPRIEQYLGEQGKRERETAFVKELRAAADVKVNLEPFRADVNAGKGARKGSASAPIQIVEFSDFQCPYCTRGAEVIDQVAKEYGDKVSVVFRHFPLPFHKEAGLAAQGAECAGEQGKFWEFHDMLFANQKALFEADLKGYAGKVGADQAKFDECLSSGRHAKTVEADLEYGKTVGMSGTPGFYINGLVISGAQPFENFKEVIDAELARKGA
ncbi:MAG: putative DsbA family dithiol-disulfide isomerase [Myxococcota bacterium]|jgi:predicted DsbA family dithiol-disulfide isomerase